MIDNKYCASSYLMYRTIDDRTKNFSGHELNIPRPNYDRVGIHNSDQLYETLKSKVEIACQNKKTALALSAGMDSAILAKFMPKGSVAYTFKCVVPGIEVTDETIVAAQYAKDCGLEHRVVEVYWEDFERYAPLLMKYKGCPIHSIEVQIYKAALQAQADGFENMLYGESADCVFGGQSNILSQDWLVGDFIDRYAYVKPYKVLRDSTMVLEPILRHEKNGHVDPFEFMAEEFYYESVGSYLNASALAGLSVSVPFAECYLAEKIDYQRIRGGENKYLVREVFTKLYPDFKIPPKTPMPRPMNLWLKNWAGPINSEFYPHCTDNMTGDQKWLVWALEKFLQE